MEALVRVNDQLTIKCASESDSELFKQIAAVQTIFEDTKCGACGGKEVRYVVREAEGFEFYEMHCKNLTCKARLSFGHSKEEKKLYAKRCETETTGKNKGKAVRDADGKAKWLPNNGWVKYTAKEESK